MNEMSEEYDDDIIYDEELEKEKMKKNEYYKEIVECECSVKLMRGNLANHKKSKKHLKMMQKKDASKNEIDFGYLSNRIIKMEDKMELLEKRVNILYGGLDILPNK